MRPFLDIVAKQNGCSTYLEPGATFTFAFDLYEPSAKGGFFYPLESGSLLVTATLNPCLYGGDCYLRMKDEVSVE